MKPSTHRYHRLIPALLGVSLATLPALGAAAPGTLSTTPLYLSTVVLPNIVFLVDDSGSMDYSLITPETDTLYTITPKDLPGLARQYGYAHPLHSNRYNTDWHTTGHTYGIELFADTVPTQAILQNLEDTPQVNNRGTADISDDVTITNLMSTYYDNWDGVWRARNADYNTMYYNPSTTYESWKGTDTNSAYYTDSPAATALIDPYLGAAATDNTIDLTSTITAWGLLPQYSDGSGTAVASDADGEAFDMSYYPAMYQTWTDSNGDGTVDASDGHTLIQIRSVANGGTTDVYNTALDGINRSGRLDCANSASSSCSYDEEIQNFANWFSYYRSRMLSAKAAISSIVVNTASARVGYVRTNSMATDTEDKNMQVLAMNTDADSGNKKDLLDSLYESTPNITGNTALRYPLQLIGEYYENTQPALFLVKVTGQANQVSSPILDSTLGGQCQQNFTVVVTDGHYNGTAPDSSISTIGNADGDASTTFDVGTNNAYGDDVSDTLADVAMHYYERDLSDLADEVPTKDGIDEAAHQHMVTYTIAFGSTGTLDPNDTKTPSDLTDTDPFDVGFNWPTFDPESAVDLPAKIDDLWHAAFNGRGQYLSAQDPEALGSTISNALLDITGRTSSAAAVAFNSTSLGTGSVVYLARFNSVTWEGELLAYELDPFSGTVASTPNWNASDTLGGQTPSTRIIYTYNNSTQLGIPFKTLTDLTTTQQADLNTNPLGNIDDQGQARLDYLRGVRTHEAAGNDYRIRSGVLGDIVHANPIYVGEPQMNFPDTVPYGDQSTTSTDADGNVTYTKVYSYFKNAKKDRAGVVYVGSNDGMLHGFHEDTGAEVMAYAPNLLFTSTSTKGLHYLTNPAYVHRYAVDLSPTVADVFIQSTPSGTVDWKTVIIGGLRGGGHGLFALDVTDPTAYTDANADDVVMWEFTKAHDPDLGATFSKPSIALMPNDRWAAVVGNGYNDTGDGQAKLFILFLDGGLDGVWTPGTDYIEIGAGVSSAGLGTPALIDTDGDGYADRAYAGDLNGNLWAFDLSNALASNWGLVSASPLFIAKDSSGTVQPITTKPIAIKHPTETWAANNAPNLLVFFGTGQFLIESDKTNTSTQTMYAVYDDGTTNTTYLRADLLQQSLESSSTATSRVPTSLTVDYGTKQGWYFDLLDYWDPTGTEPAGIGERIVVNPKIRGDYVFFNTLIPETRACNYGGFGWLMALTQLDGARPSSGSVFDINNDGVVDDNDKIGSDAAGGMRFDEGLPAESNFLSNNQYTPGSTGNLEQGTVNAGTAIEAGRMSWREIILE